MASEGNFRGHISVRVDVTTYAAELGRPEEATRPMPGDADARLAAIFDAQYAGLCRLAGLILGDDHRAEEVVMEAFLRTYVSWRRIREPEKAEAYLRRAVVNLARTSATRRGTERRANARLHASESTAVFPAADSGVDADPVLRAVRELPAGQRAAVVLRYYADLPETEVAQLLGCAVGTVKSQLSKARATLSRLLSTTEEA